MSYKCLECGHIFEEGEEIKYNEYIGEWRGRQAIKELKGCPLCLGSFEKTIPCAICGSEHLEDELNGRVCDECIDEYRKDFNVCYEISIVETEEIKINSLLASLFDPSDIEQILKEYIRDRWQDVDCSPFIDSDISWFGERLAKEVKKNECEKK